MNKEQIIKILNSVDGGNEILDYITELEDNQCKCEEEEGHHHHDEECDCGHHHDDKCDCGCHDEDDDYEDITPKDVKKITVEQWEELLKDKTVFNEDSLIIVKRMRHVAAPVTSADLADMFGYGALYYSIETDKLAERIADKLKIKVKDDELWSIVLNGWRDKSHHSDNRIYALRPELYEAIGNVDMSKVPLRMG